MVHHKIHDEGWTGLPLLPRGRPAAARAARVRRPRRRSTSPRSAAQGARLFGAYDAAFADRLLERARAAWDAALAHPASTHPRQTATTAAARTTTTT